MKSGQSKETLPMAKSKSKSTPSSKPSSSSPSKGKSKAKPKVKSAKLILARMKKRLVELQEELERKNAVLQVYADHTNWVRPEEVRERLGIPEKDRAGKTIDQPAQCFVGARYPWEPALKAMLGFTES